MAEHILPPARPGQLRSDGGRGRGEWNEGVAGVVPDPGREPLIEARRLNGLGRLVMAAERCGPQIFDDTQGFDERFRRSRFARPDRAVLDLVCPVTLSVCYSRAVELREFK